MALLEQDSELAPLAGRERRSRRPLRESLTLPVLLASVALNAACFTLLVNEELGRGEPRPAELVQTVGMMEQAIRQRARPAEAKLQYMQKRARPARQGQPPSRQAGGGSAQSRRARARPGRFSLRTLDGEMSRDQILDHAAPKPSATLEGMQQLSGVHAEAQFNFEGTTFGRLEPRLANATEPEEEEEKGPVFMEDAPPGTLEFGGKDCSPTEIIGGVGVPNPYDALFPEEFNQITIEAWVKDCNLMDFNGYIGLHDVRNAPADAGAGGVWTEYAGGGVKDKKGKDAGFLLGTYKKAFAFGLATTETGRMTWLQAPDWLSKPNQCEWVHIAGTYDGATMALFIDGLYTKCSVTQTGAINIPEIGGKTGAKFLMGGYSYAPPLAGLDPATLTGQLDEVRLWSVARTPEEIALQMHTTLPWETPDVMFYFRFDGQQEHKSPKVCAEYFGIKGKIGCDSSIVDGGAPALSQGDPPMGCGGPAPQGDRTMLNPDWFHTGFNPSQSSFVQQDLEDCGPDHNNCDGGAYTDPDYNRAGFY
jgi:hypothetical protein